LSFRIRLIMCKSVKKSNIKKTCLGVNKKVKKAIKKRNKIWERYRCTKSDADYKRYL